MDVPITLPCPSCHDALALVGAASTSHARMHWLLPTRESIATNGRRHDAAAGCRVPRLHAISKVTPPPFPGEPFRRAPCFRSAGAARRCVRSGHHHPMSEGGGGLLATLPAHHHCAAEEAGENRCTAPRLDAVVRAGEQQHRLLAGFDSMDDGLGRWAVHL